MPVKTGGNQPPGQGVSLMGRRGGAGGEIGQKVTCGIRRELSVLNRNGAWYHPKYTNGTFPKQNFTEIRGLR